MGKVHILVQKIRQEAHHQIVRFPEDELHKLRGVDATLYVRFLRGCFYFALLHTFTTFPILFPIHVKFSDDEIPSKSMTRASISSLVTTDKGLSVLWIHMCLLFWVTLSWMATLIWVCDGAFRLRAKTTQKLAAKRKTFLQNPESVDTGIYQHPHPQYAFQDIPTHDRNHPNFGLRLRTVMVSNVPSQLRDEKVLKEYFEYYLSRKIEKPSMGLTSSVQPGFINKSVAFLFNKAKRIPAHLPEVLLPGKSEDESGDETKRSSSRSSMQPPVIERVVVARKMTELASLLERREEILRLLETAHIKLATKALAAAKEAMTRKDGKKPVQIASSKAAEAARKRRSEHVPDLERGEGGVACLNDEEQLDKLVETLGPFVRELESELPRGTLRKPKRRMSKQSFQRLTQQSPTSSANSSDTEEHTKYPPDKKRRRKSTRGHPTVWDALLSLPRDILDPYQPLVSLNQLFRGKPVPAIDYYTAKLNLLTSLITENRSKSISDFDPVSTAFVTFADPADARKACKYLAVHPNNPLACLVTMAPEYQDLDWNRVMKSSFHGEFLKDWIVNAGVWGFTLFWLFPVSLLVGLVSIQNISLFWPSLKTYLERHPWQSEVIQSFIPTILVALLAILIPLILLLIAKKAHTITTLSALHDLIMTRYYKFLIVNVLVFFCVGTAAMQSILQSFKNIAGPFYVGWLIFTTAMHGGFELVLLGLPLLTYPATSRQVTPRKRAVGIRPRTLNYYYWLPNHLLVLHILLLFCLLNPFVLPFGALYFFIQSGVIKNQLIHVYAKHYEGNGKVLLIRMVRYSLDGLVLSLVVMLAYMVVLQKKANVGVCAFLIVFTVLFKLLLTRMCRAQFELDDIAEAEALCGQISLEDDPEINPDDPENLSHQERKNLIETGSSKPSVLTLKLPRWMNFSYNTLRQQPRHKYRRKPIPFDSPPSPGENQRTFRRERPSEASPASVLDSDAKLPRDGFPWQAEPSFQSSNPAIRLITSANSDTGPVVPHPPRLTWDDQDTIDLPYDNPYYTRPINNVLWLPRNPLGALNLDDTVDLKISLTVELSAGQLGSWLGLVQRSSPGELSQSDRDATSSHINAVSPPMSLKSLPAVDGTEDIELPPRIMRRVKSGENGIEPALRPRRSTISRNGRRRANTTSEGGPRPPLASGSLARRRTSMLEVPPVSHMPPASDAGSGPSRMGRGRSSSILSALQLAAPSSLNRVSSNEQEFGVRPDAHAQAELVLSVANNSALSLPKTPTQKPQNLSAQEAIFHEILAEEEQALITRLEDEEAESLKSKSSKSWLTSWMFKRGD
ncbi:hypothetical protein CC1G_07165 [Coprinopsis cinerea okayama7|uniref:DUF221 domain-containing protein n=1 Tax=Coprinopsis cinerea (strain Okayama-7 / 130 / ATCC MYA-4618 / FGSC 9003) TaxID=240176 RepID=A8NRB2_COPC7|nr:hypothetical protein CC1G_07165 [Coprinopsis cinerea okayama7\|eukprot:XP_001835741.2 hypothetical protein CC1G_07165 [Coprinopsis cinerea okayama7\